MSFLTEYNYTISYVKGSTNKPDPLSRRPDFDDGSKDNEGEVLLSKINFNHFETLVPSHDIENALREEPCVIEPYI